MSMNKPLSLVDGGLDEFKRKEVMAHFTQDFPEPEINQIVHNLKVIGIIKGCSFQPTEEQIQAAKDAIDRAEKKLVNEALITAFKDEQNNSDAATIDLPGLNNMTEAPVVERVPAQIFKLELNPGEKVITFRNKDFSIARIFPMTSTSKAEFKGKLKMYVKARPIVSADGKNLELRIIKEISDKGWK